MRVLKSVSMYAPSSRMRHAGGNSRKTSFWKNPHRVAITNRRHVVRLETDDLERAQLGEPGFHREVGPPEQPPRPECLERLVEHAAIHAAPGEIGQDVRMIGDRGERVHVIPAPTDV